MKAKHLILPLLLGTLTTAQAKPYNPAASTLHFLENKGQVKDQNGQQRNDIQYSTGSPGLKLFIGNGQLHYQWSQQLSDLKAAMYRMDVALIGANPNAAPTTEQQEDYYERYYTISPEGKIAHSYQKITYKEVYPNIDWVLHINGNKVEYDFVVHTGGKVSDIQLQYGGATDLRLDNGQLTATTPMGVITEAAPVSTDATGKEIATAFTLSGNTVHFIVAAYTGTLTIDPTLSWSTYYGGSGNEAVKMGCVAGDNAGNSYLGGNTASASSITTTGSYQDTLTSGTTDAFLVKFSSTGARLWATYYGGEGTENVYGITCDPAGKIYLSGYTNSTIGMATTGSYQPALNAGSQDAFLAKFDGTGAREWATYYGGDATEQGLAVACDTTGNVYLAGYTLSAADIATAGAYQTVQAGGQDAFLVKFSSAGSRLWGTYYGGSSTEQGLGVTCDNHNNVFLTGYTQSTSGIATTGGYQTVIGGSKDAFLVKFDSTGAQQWGTYLGGSAVDGGYSLACDEAGSAYLTGSVASTTGIATTGSFQSVYGGGAGDGMLAKFSSAGALRWCTYYGGAANDAGYGLSYRSGNIYMAGVSSSTTGIATTGTFQDTISGSSDAILIKFDTSGARVWGTYFGAESSDYGYGVFCNSSSQIFLGGQTSSFGLLATGSYQTSNGGGNDGYLVKFNDCVLAAPAAITGNDTVCRGSTYTYSVLPVSGATSYTWILPSGWSGSSTTNTLSLVAGSNSDTIKVVANYPCGASVVVYKAVKISPLPTISPAGAIGICNGDSATLTASTATTYQWLHTGIPILGATTNTYVVHGGGNYAIIGMSTSGCADTSLADTVTVHPLPVPAITMAGTVLSTGTYVTYQWSHDGTAITGAVSQTYTMVTTSGDYMVTVTDTNGCTGNSAAFTPSLGVAGTTAVCAISIYPNPTSDLINISAPHQVNISLVSAQGRLQGVYKNTRQVDMSAFADGVYFLKITDMDGNPIGIEKIVKMSIR